MRRRKTLQEFKGTIVERLPSGKLDVFNTYGMAASVPDSPDALVCDCCLQYAGRLWCYAHWGFCIKMLGWRRVQYEAGAWAFCADCHALIRELQLLAARVVMINPVLDLQVTLATYELMLACLHGEPKIWQSGTSRKSVFP